MDNQPQRQRLFHTAPGWVKDGSLYFVTICTEPRLKNQLCVSEVGPRLIESVAYYHDSGRWWAKLFLLMPVHLHALVAMPKEESLETVIRMWKSYQTKTLGIEWQSGFFDHRLRSDESEEEKANYVRMNPVRAGLVARTEDWPYVWPKG